MLKFTFLRPVLRQYAVIQIANLSVMLLGMSIVWGSPMLIKLRAKDQTILSQPITEDEEAWIVSISTLVGLTGLVFGGSLMNIVGRKTTIMISYIPRIAMCFLKIFATEVWMILLARSFGGIADLLSLSAISTYISEVAGKQIRGVSGTMTQINSATGMLIMFGVGPFVSYLTMNILMTGIVVAAFIPLLFMPESPYFLHSKGDISKSLEVLTFLHGTELAREEIKEYSKANTDTKEGLQTLFKDRIVIKTFVIVIIIAIGSQLIGYNAVNFYLQSIFESTQTLLSSEVSSLIIGVIQLIACLVTLFLTDRFGRKPILCATLAGMAVGMIGLGSFFTVVDNGMEITGFLNFLPLISVAIVIFGYNAGLGAVIWMLIAELLRGPVRPYGISLGVFVSCFFTFLQTRFFPVITAAIGPAATYWTFAAGCVFVCLFIGFGIPETKGKTFAEIQKALGV